jgi:hypothetical protein
MTNLTLGYYSDAAAIRQALRNHGPMTRADLVKATDLSREKLAKSLYALRKQGDVVMDGDLVLLVTTEDMPIPATETALESTQDSGVVPTYQNRSESVTEGKITASTESPATDPIAAITAALDELATLRKENAEIQAAYDRLAVKFDEVWGENADLKQRLKRIRHAMETDA